MSNTNSPYTASELRDKLLKTAVFYRANPELANRILGALYLFLDDYVELGLQQDRFDINCGTNYSGGEDNFIEFGQVAGMSDTSLTRFLDSTKAFPEGMKGIKVGFSPRKKTRAYYFKRLSAPKADVLNFLRETGIHAKSLNQLHRRINHGGEICGLGFYDAGEEACIQLMTIDDISRHFPDLRDENEIPGIIYHRLEQGMLSTTAKQFLPEVPLDILREKGVKWKKMLSFLQKNYEDSLPRYLGMVHPPEQAAFHKVYFEICGNSRKSSLESFIGAEKELDVLKGLPFLAGR